MSQKETTGIWVFVEINHNEIHPATFELLSKAQELSQKNQEKVTAILFETLKTNHALTLIGYGADQVVVVKDDKFSMFDPIIYKDAFVNLAHKYQPSIILFAATFIGKSLAPRIQGALKTGLTADCLDLSINDKGQLVQIKPSYGDNLMCTILIPEARPQMTTVRPYVFTPLKFDDKRKGEVIEEKMELVNPFVFEIIKQEKIANKAETISDAKHVVAVGRGIKQEADLKEIEKLANLLNAKIGVTRPLAEKGWYPLEQQIGQSGQTIQPELILNFGIAGAVQYTVGMKNSKFVFSVNTDKNAAIFKESDYGYLGDAKTFATELIKVLTK